MKKNNSNFTIIQKYWQKTPELFSQKYQINLVKLLSPVNLFLFLRRNKVLKLAPNVKDKKILDVGCGSGVFMIDFVLRGAYVAGIDYSQKMLDIAKKELNFYKIPKNKYILKKAEATKLPFGQNEFDFILATGLTDYLKDQENQRFLQEAARVLKKSGTLIVSFPVEKSRFSFVRSGVGLKIRQKFFKLPPISNSFSLEKVRKFLGNAGLEETEHHKILTTMWLILARFKK